MIERDLRDKVEEQTLPETENMDERGFENT